MASAKDQTYFVTYNGDSIVNVKDAGTFQKGTSAFVTEEVAQGLEKQGGWTVVAPKAAPKGAQAAPPSPWSAPAPAPRVEERKHEPAPAPAPKAEEKKHEPAKAEEKKHEEKETKKAEEKAPEPAEKASA